MNPMQPMAREFDLRPLLAELAAVEPAWTREDHPPQDSAGAGQAQVIALRGWPASAAQGRARRDVQETR